MRTEFLWDSGQISCGLRLGQHYCGFRSARPQLAVLQDMFVSPFGSPALVTGFVGVPSRSCCRSGSLLSSSACVRRASLRSSIGPLDVARGEGVRDDFGMLSWFLLLSPLSPLCSDWPACRNASQCPPTNVTLSLTAMITGPSRLPTPNVLPGFPHSAGCHRPRSRNSAQRRWWRARHPPS